MGGSGWISTLISSQALNSGGEEREALTDLLAALGDSTIKDMNDTEGKATLEVGQ